MTSTATTPPAGASAEYIAIACGGTGGHLFPGLAVAEQLMKRGCALTLLISPKDVDQQAIKEMRRWRSEVGQWQSAPPPASLSAVTLPAVALQSGKYLAFVRGFWQSWRAARELFRARPPQAALAMGGFTSAPPILAARALGAKTFLHESNSIPGRANRWLARFVDQAFVGFPSATARLHVREATVTGTPVRSEFGATVVPPTATCRAALGLDPTKPVVLVMGGSQGASGVNEMILSVLPGLATRAPHWQWLHLTGPNDFEKARQTYTTFGLKAVVHPFLPEMNLALGAATVAVSRAGASSLAELAAMRLPSLLVPFPYAADNHQFHNASAFAKTGAARLLEQKDAAAETVADVLWELVENAGTRDKMRSALAQWHAPKAAEQIAEMILQSVGQRASATETTNRESSERKVQSSSDIPGSYDQAKLQATGLGVWTWVLASSFGLCSWSFCLA